MVSTIVLNQNNIVKTDGKNNTLVYKFPNSVSFPNHEIAIQSVNMFYSWTNINTSPLNNNNFSYIWRNSGGTSVTYTVTLPSGLYEISDINNYLQYVFIQNGHYLINSQGQNVYFAEIIVNPTLYKIQVNTFPIPATTTGFTTPPTWNAATSYFNPSFTFPSNFNDIIGFAAGFTTSLNAGVNTNLSYTSSTTPQVQPNSNLLFSISNISNNYANPSTIIYSLAPSVAIGQQIIEKPPQLCWNRLTSGTYNEIRLQLLGTDLQSIEILDPQMTILLAIRNYKEDMGGN